MDETAAAGDGQQWLPVAAAAFGSLAEASAKAAAVAGSVWERSDADLLAVLRADQVAAAQREGARLAVLRELDRRGTARAGGAASTAAWLSHELLVDPRAAAADVRAARELDPDADTPPASAAPLTCAPAPGVVPVAAAGRALLGGEVSRAHADAVATMVRGLPLPCGTVTPAQVDDLRARAQAWLLGQCGSFTPADVRRLGVALRHVVDPDGVLTDERDAAARSSFWVRAEGDGVAYRFGGVTDPVTAAQLTTFVDAHSAPRPAVDETTGEKTPDPRTADQRRGQAFTDLVNLAVNADPGVSGGVGVQLVVTTTLNTLQAQLGQTGVRCADTESGQFLSAATVRRLACDATVVPMVLGSAGEPLDVGRATRTIPTGIRRALMARDHGCAFPGCTRPPRWADGHHIKHWSNGGPTALHNLVLLCRHHHDVIHHTGWTVTITDGRPAFSRPPPHGTDPLGRPPDRSPPRAPV